jgi:hypothetical protein
MEYAIVNMSHPAHVSTSTSQDYTKASPSRHIPRGI